MTVLIGQAIGAGDPERAGRIVGTAILLFGAFCLVLMIVLIALAPALASLMQAPAEAFGGTVLYIRICAVGLAFITAYHVIGSMFRGLGDSVMPLVTVAIACVCNIAGDLLLAGYFRMGVKGVAIATVFAQGVSVLASLLIVRRRGLPFVFSKDSLRLDPQIARELLGIGIPTSAQDVLVTLSFIAIASIVNGLGLVASAGVGVAERICSFVMLVPSTFSAAMSAFTAQNYGAGKLDRAEKGLLYGISVSLGVGIFMFLFMFFRGDIPSSWFAAGKADVIAASADYLKAYAIDCLLTSFLFCFNGFFNGLGRTRFVMTQSVIGAFGVRIPVSYLMSKEVPVSLFHVGLATPCSTAVQIVLCFVWFFRLRKARY
jgi:putative MATE family efflux protein